MKPDTGESRKPKAESQNDVFVDGCWVTVDVDGFVYTERVICAGDPEFIEVE